MDNRFNLVDEPWIPIADVGRVSLRQVFSNSGYRSLSGNPVQKIALMKLLLAIAQAAQTPADELEWKALGAEGLAQRCLDYLQQWHERFYLYGEQPFLQMPAIAAAAVQSYGAVLPEIASGNTTVLSQIQVRRPLDDAQKAMLLVSLMAFALAGKKTDNSVTLSVGYQGKRNDKNKPSSSKPGPAVAHMGLLHSFLLGDNLQQSLWLNLLTARQLEQANIFAQGTGTAPWEQMPEGENCAVAQMLKQSLQGRLVPLCRFCLLTDDGLHYSEGLAHAGHKEGIADPTVAINYAGKEPKALWVNPQKRPWRELTSLLGVFEQGTSQGFQSLQLRAGLDRARDVTAAFAIWSGGLSVSSNAGEQYVAGKDDAVESVVWLHSSQLGAHWFALLKAEMAALDALGKHLFGRVMGFFKEQKVDGGKLADQATHLFWQLCERNFQDLLDSCNPDEQGLLQRHGLRKAFAGYVQRAYDQFCPKESARQLDAWAKYRPNNSKYLQQEA
jgi:CRISPR system Cascade subunit CasA